jgi:gliding motility-associated lipoprotein GldD
MVKKTVFGILMVMLLVSCGNDYMPKPDGFLRIDLPAKTYQPFDSIYPYAFDYPKYAKIVSVKNPEQPFWLNIEIPRYKATIYLSYKPVNNNLNTYLEDTRTYVMKHIPKATAIDAMEFSAPNHQVYGLMYEIQGSEAASPCQFYLTDSTKHFLRGALYFNTTPNNDSLAPVIEFIKQDIKHLAQTLTWK